MAHGNDRKAYVVIWPPYMHMMDVELAPWERERVRQLIGQLHSVSDGLQGPGMFVCASNISQGPHEACVQAWWMPTVHRSRRTGLPFRKPKRRLFRWWK